MRFGVFDRLVVLAPFLIPLVVSIGVLSGIISERPSFNWRSALISSIFLSLAVFTLLWRISTLQQSKKEPFGSRLAAVTKQSARRAAALFFNSFIGAVFTMFLLGVPGVRNWLGSLFFGCGLLLCILVVVQLNRLKTLLREVITDRADVDVRELDNLFRSYADRRMVILAGQTLAGIISIVFYLYSGHVEYFSLWDLIGFLFFLAIFSAWHVRLGQYLSAIAAPKSRGNER